MNHAFAFSLFAFAALGFVWSVEATAKVILKILGL